jgi:hypothetical protein
MYDITPYTYRQALKLGVKIAPSKNPSKKVDVFDYSGNLICSVGFYGMGDFPTYLKSRGKTFADERRRLYKIRNQKTRVKLGTPAYYADNLLW